MITFLSGASNITTMLLLQAGQHPGLCVISLMCKSEVEERASERVSEWREENENERVRAEEGDSKEAG